MEITKQQKSEFLKMYGELCKKGVYEHNLISMGNFAFFVDRCLRLPKTRELKKKVISLVGSGRPQDFQELCLLISSHIHQMAKRDQVGENLDFRLKRIEAKYESGKLDHFDMLLDEHNFPSWFQTYIPFIDASDDQSLKREYMKIIQLNEELHVQMKYDGLDTKLFAYLPRMKDHSFKWQLMLLLVDSILDWRYFDIKSLLDLKIPSYDRDK